MLTENIKYNLNCFEKELSTWQQRFKQDPKDRLFINYISMSQKIKDQAKININPAIQTLQEIQEEYGEKYRNKDIKYHIDMAVTNYNELKKILKEIHDLYYNQTPYDKIKLFWEIQFTTLFKKLTNVKERVYILDRILSAEN